MDLACIEYKYNIYLHMCLNRVVQYVCKCLYFLHLLIYRILFGEVMPMQSFIEGVAVSLLRPGHWPKK